MKKVVTAEEMKNCLARHTSLNHSILIAWKPGYDLGIPIVDEQHRGIVSIINSLYYGMQNKCSDNMLTPAVSMVREYTHIHFNLEEDFLEKCKFPNLKYHHELHQEMIDSLSIVGKESQWNRDPYQFMNFLKSWWLNHICDEDRVFLDYILA